MPPDSFDKKLFEQVDWKQEYEVISTLKNMGHLVFPIAVFDDISVITRAVENFKPHIVFNLLMEFDGSVTQEAHIVCYLELIRIPYTGCNPQGLQLCIDKAINKKILNYHKIKTPTFFTCRRNKKSVFPITMKYPCIVKSLVEDASFGISQASVVNNNSELLKRVAYLHDSLDTDVLVEEYIDGKEYYVGVLGNTQLTVFPIWELTFGSVPNNFNRISTERVKWNSSYRKKYNIHSVNAKNLPVQISKLLRETSKQAFRLLGLTGYACFDYRLSETEELYLIDINPNPGISNSRFGIHFSDRYGISYEDMLNKLISLGFSSHKQRIINQN